MLQRLRTTGSDPLGDGYPGLDLSPRELAWMPRSLGAGVHALLATTPPKNNHGIVAGDEAALIIDAGISSRVSRMIQEHATSLTGSPVRYLVNTSHRGDHTFGNAAFPASVQVLASADAKAAMRDFAAEKARLMLSPGGEDTAFSELTEWRIPEATFGAKLDIDLGGMAVQLWHFGPGGSPGDAVVYVPQARTAWTGDFVSHAGIPPIHLDGCPLAYAASLRRMRELLPDLKTVIPAHGPAGDAQTSISWLITYLQDLYGNVKALWDCGASARETLAVCRLSCCWSAPPSLSAVMADYAFTDPGSGHSSIAALATSLHRAGIMAAYRWLEQHRPGRDELRNPRGWSRGSAGHRDGFAAGLRLAPVSAGL